MDDELRISPSLILRLAGTSSLHAVTELSFQERTSQRLHIRKIENLDSLTNLKWLNLAENLISQIENLLTLSSLEHLSLAGNLVRSVPLFQIEHLRQLQVFRLERNKVSSLKEFANLSVLPRLDTLTVQGNPACEQGNVFLFLVFHVQTLKHIEGVTVTAEHRQDAAELYRGSPVQREQLITYRRSLSSIQDTKREDEGRREHIQRAISELDSQIRQLTADNKKCQTEIANIQHALSNTSQHTHSESVRNLVAQVEEVRQRADALQRLIAQKREELLKKQLQNSKPLGFEAYLTSDPATQHLETEELEQEVKRLEVQHDATFELLAKLTEEVLKIEEDDSQDECVDRETRELLRARLEELHRVGPEQQRMIAQLEQEKFSLELKARTYQKSIDQHHKEIKNIQDIVYNCERDTPNEATQKRWDDFPRAEDAPKTTRIRHQDSPGPITPQDSVLFAAPYTLSASHLDFKLQSVPPHQEGTEDQEASSRLHSTKEKMRAKELKYTYKLAQLKELTTSKTQELKSLIEQYEQQVGAIAKTQNSEANENQPEGYQDLLECLTQVASVLGLKTHSQTTLTKEIRRSLHKLREDLAKAATFKKNKEKFMKLYTQNTSTFEGKLRALDNELARQEQVKSELQTLRVENKHLQRLLQKSGRSEPRSNKEARVKDTCKLQSAVDSLQVQKLSLREETENLKYTLDTLKDLIYKYEQEAATKECELLELKTCVQSAQQEKARVSQECFEAAELLETHSHNLQVTLEKKKLEADLSSKSELKAALSQDIELLQRKQQEYATAVSELEEQHQLYNAECESLQLRVNTLKDEEETLTRELEALRLQKDQELQEHTEEVEALREMARSGEETLRHLVHSTEKYRKTYLEYKKKCASIRKEASAFDRTGFKTSPLDDNLLRSTRLEEPFVGKFQLPH